MTDYTKGQDIWVKLAWADDEFVVDGTFITETEKRYKVDCPFRGGVIYVAKKNVSPRFEKCQPTYGVEK